MTTIEPKLTGYKPPLVTLLVLFCLGIICATLFTPGLPEIASYFNVKQQVAQLTLTVFLLGYTLGQLPYGPLSNRFGRKTALYLGVSQVFIGAVFCILSKHYASFTLLLIGRFITALGASIALAICFTIIEDCYNLAEAEHVLAYFAMAYAAVPGISITVGGTVTGSLGWNGCFYFLLIYLFVLLILLIRLPETAKKLEPDALHLPRILRGYYDALKSKGLILFSFLSGGIPAAVYIFSAQAPFIAMHTIGMDVHRYGFLTLIPSVGMLIGAEISARLADKLKAKTTLFSGLAIALTGAVVMTACFAYGYVNSWTLFLPTTLLFFGIIFLFSSTTALATEFVTNKSDGAAAKSFIILATSSICVLAMSALNASVLILPITLVGLIIAMIMASLFAIKQMDDA